MDDQPGSDLQESEGEPVTVSGARKWGGRGILGLQRAYDKLLAGRVSQLQTQAIEQDRELADLAHDVAELRAQVNQMNRILQSIEQRLAHLEESDNNHKPS
jgi:uncharacterized coiled-coil protein SlyX